MEELERMRSKAKQKDALVTYNGIVAQNIKEADVSCLSFPINGSSLLFKEGDCSLGN